MRGQQYYESGQTVVSWEELNPYTQHREWKSMILDEDLNVISDETRQISTGNSNFLGTSDTAAHPDVDNSILSHRYHDYDNIDAIELANGNIMYTADATFQHQGITQDGFDGAFDNGDQEVVYWIIDPDTNTLVQDVTNAAEWQGGSFNPSLISLGTQIDPTTGNSIILMRTSDSTPELITTVVAPDGTIVEQNASTVSAPVPVGDSDFIIDSAGNIVIVYTSATGVGETYDPRIYSHIIHPDGSVTGPTIEHEGTNVGNGAHNLNLIQKNDGTFQPTFDSSHDSGIAGTTGRLVTANLDIAGTAPPPPASDGYVDGTGGADVIDTSYTGDPDGDRVDNNDAILAGHTGNDDYIRAGGGGDTIRSGLGDDTVEAGGGNDTIILEDNFGTDTIDGGNNNDTLDASEVTGDVTVDLSAVSPNNNERGTLTEGSNVATFEEIENIILGGGDDTVIGSNDHDVNISLGAGADTFTGGAGNDVADLGNDTDTDTIVLRNGDGNDSYTSFLGPSSDGSGGITIPSGIDQLDVSGMTVDGTSNTDPVHTGNVTDLTASGNTITLTFSNGMTLDLEVNDPSVFLDTRTREDSLVAIGFPRAPAPTSDGIVEGTGSGELIDTSYSGDPDGDFVDNNDAVNGHHGAADGSNDDYIQAKGGNDTVLSGLGGDYIEAGGGNDTVVAGEGDDTVLGENGDDTVTGGAGNDTITGGDGDDTFIYENTFNHDTETGGEGSENNGGDTIDASAVSENLTLDLRSDGTGINQNGATDSESGVLYRGGGGTHSTDFVEIENVILGSGDDTVIGSSGNDVNISLGAGADTVTGGAGDDGMDLGTDTDTDTIILRNGDGNDTINGAYSGDPDGDFVDAGDAKLPGESNNDDIIQAGAGNDTIQAGNGSDEVFGGTGDDTITGGSGNDDLCGEDGDDTFVYDGGFNRDTVTGGEGAESGGDTLDASAVTQDLTLDLRHDGGDVSQGSTNTAGIDDNESGRLYRGGGGTHRTDFQEVENFLLGSGDDTVHGSNLGDTVHMGDGNNDVDSGLGNDHITTGSGNDDVNLGDGDDTVIITAGTNTLTGGTGTDTLGVDDGATGPIEVTVADDGSGSATLDGGTSTLTGMENFFGQDDGDTDVITLTTLVEDCSTITGLDTIAAVGTFTEDGTGTVIAFGGTGQPTLASILAGDNKGTVQITDGAESGKIGNISFEEMETINFDIDVVCFVRGARITTETGEIAVEDLKAGMRVLTRDNGYQTLRWIGSRVVQGQGKLAPVRIQSGTLGATRDLLLSQQHRVLLRGYQAELLFGEEEVLVPAKALVNDKTIRVESTREVEYFHLMFDQHEIIYSDGAATESFYPGGVALSSVETEAQEEIYALFPELRSDPGACGEVARPEVKAHDAFAFAV